MALVLRHRRNSHPRLVVHDGGDTLGIPNHRVPARQADVDRECFVWFASAVTVHEDGNRFRGFADGETVPDAG
jgi:hypothetical protein